MTGQLDPNNPTTIGAAVQDHIVISANSEVTLQIWDT
jgi:hypothetical protein